MKMFMYCVLVLVLLSCGNKNTPTINAPEEDPPQTTSDASHLTAFYKDWYYTSTPNIIGSYFYQINLAETEKLPTVGAFLFSVDLVLQAVVYGKFYSSVNTEEVIPAGEELQTYGTFKTAYGYVYVDTNVLDIERGSYALIFTAQGKSREDIARQINLFLEKEKGSMQLKRLMPKRSD